MQSPATPRVLTLLRRVYSGSYDRLTAANRQKVIRHQARCSRITAKGPVRPCYYLEPASTAVPAAAAKQQNDNYNHKKRVDIHVCLTKCCVLRSLEPEQRLAGRPVPNTPEARP
jgi:hypothetical protein